ncbi:c-type cytochrome [Flavobacteriaceae bacterium KMM 6898]|nr:c-type cytochrome [Flavobacteriaceae bacterium KMM 6898]
MKRFAKILGKLVLAVLIIFIVTGIFIYARGIPSYTAEIPEFKVTVTPESVERGQKLVSMLCAGCHMNSATGKLTGTRMLDAPSEFGEIYSQNITQDKTYGIGDWTDAELVYLLRTGIKRDGNYSPPYMAKLPGLADSDMNAIVSFLRSDNHMVNPDPMPDRPTKPSMLTKLLCHVAWKPFSYPTKPVELPNEKDSIAMGKYLANNLDCFSCHSADFKTNDFQVPENSAGYFAGGNKPLNKKGEIMMTPNLTPDKETGIGNWSKEKFIKALKTGVLDEEVPLRYPMTPYTQLTDKEAGAIYAFLMTLEPVRHNVPRSGLTLK